MAPLLYASPVFWLTIVLCAATGLAYRLAWVAGSRYMRPSDMDILIEEEALSSTQTRRGGARCCPPRCCTRARAPTPKPRASEEADALPMSAHAADGV